MKIFLFLLIIIFLTSSCHKDPVACGTVTMVAADTSSCSCSIGTFTSCASNAEQTQWKIYNNDCRDSLGNLVGYTVLFGETVVYHYGVSGTYRWEQTVWNHGRKDNTSGEVTTN